MLAENALTTLERMKLMLGLSDIEDEKVNLIVELLINKASSWIERQTGSRRQRGALWYGVGRYVYVPLAVILCCVALFMNVAF